MLLMAPLASELLPNMLIFISTGSGPSAIISRFRLGQPENSSLMGLFQPGTMVTSSRLVQPLNTPLPTVVAVAGIGLIFSAVQPVNENLAMLVQVSGSVMLVTSLQFSKHLAAVATTVYSVPS